MSTAKIAQGARTQLAGAAAALNGLANGAYATVGTIVHNSGGKVPLDTSVELTLTPGTVSGNQQALLFAQFSLDGAQFTSGPNNGTSTTNEPNLILIGALPLRTSGGSQRKTFSIATANNSLLPYATTLIVKNDSGAALGTSTNDVYFQDYSGDIS